MRITKLITTLFLSILFMLSWSVSHAQVTPKNVPLKTEIQAYRINAENILLTLTLHMETDWYTYGNIPGEMGKPTQLSGTLANGTTPIIPIYPEGVRKPDAYDPSIMVDTFKNGTRLYTVINDDGQSFPVKLNLELLLCHPTKCVPVKRELIYGPESDDLMTLPSAQDQPWWSEFTRLAEAKVNTLKAQAPPIKMSQQGVIEWNFTPRYLQPQLEVTSLLSAILMGLLAGLILNIMPCVLPVVSLKLSALLNSTTVEKEEDRIASFREHNIFFSLGVIAFFLLLAIVLGATGQAWGALFQHQWLVLAVATVVFILSLSLFGVFHLPVIDLKFGVESTNPRIQAFFTGNLTTLLATPCSGPFLGGVLSWALVQGPLVLSIVFISIGVGMASPYLLMAIWPGLSRFLPKSGPWIEYVEKGIAFFLVATAFYLISIALGGETLRILAPLWAAILGIWLWIKTKDSQSKNKWPIRIAPLILLALTIVWTTPPQTEESPWQKFIPTELSQLIGKEKLFLEFTADWCPTCKVLEATVMTDKNVSKWKKQYGITFIKVDMTERDPEAEALLQALGSMSIPTSALFSTGPNSTTPTVIRDLFTESQLEEILKSWEK